jgi:hypothetical protein
MTRTDFAYCTRQLRDRIGREDRITASVAVDQVYAHYQHEHLDFRHPRGGSAKYLEGPLYKHYRDYLEAYSNEVLRDGGVHALERAAEHLSDQVEVEAPREWGDLMRSGHPQVREGERVVYDRAPKVRRISEAELRLKSRAILRARLAAGLTVYFMKNGRIHVIPGKNEPHALRGRL